jgi:hypothetical protein
MSISALPIEDESAMMARLYGPVQWERMMQEAKPTMRKPMSTEVATLESLDMAEVQKDVARFDTKLEAAALTSVGGYLRLDGDTKLEAAALTSVGGDLLLYGGAKLEAAALTSVGGDLLLYDGAKLEAAALTSVGGDLRLDGGAKLEAAALKNVNGNPYKK